MEDIKRLINYSIKSVLISIFIITLIFGVFLYSKRDVITKNVKSKIFQSYDYTYKMTQEGF